MDDKYHWHDLTEDPKDLPEDTRDVLVCYRQRLTGRENYEVNWRMESEWSGEEDYDMLYWNVVAWRDIEPFEEEDSLARIRAGKGLTPLRVSGDALLAAINACPEGDAFRAEINRVLELGVRFIESQIKDGKIPDWLKED